MGEREIMEEIRSLLGEQMRLLENPLVSETLLEYTARQDKIDSLVRALMLGGSEPD